MIITRSSRSGVAIWYRAHNACCSVAYSILVHGTPASQILNSSTYKCLEGPEYVKKSSESLSLPVLGQQTQPSMRHSLPCQLQLEPSPNTCPGSVPQRLLQHCHILQFLWERERQLQHMYTFRPDITVHLLLHFKHSIQWAFSHKVYKSNMTSCPESFSAPSWSTLVMRSMGYAAALSGCDFWSCRVF